MSSPSTPRVLIVHEWLYTWAGAERVLEQIVALYPDADVLASVVTPAMRETNPIAARATESWLGRIPGARSKHRWFLPLQALAFATADTRRYDLVLSSSHAFAKAVRAAPQAKHLCYCHSPPRYLWDMQSTYMNRMSAVERSALAVMAPVLRAVDRQAARGVDQFIANSQYVARRIARVYGRDARVIHPPVAIKAGAGTAGPREDFLLSLGRLVPYKRVDLAIRTANQSGMRLVIAGDGPERRSLEALAGPTCEFVGSVSEAEAARLLSTCSAFVFCAEEDFGIAPLEANAHGAPVVALRRGGVTETIPDGIAGTFYDEETPEAVAAAVRRCLERSWDEKALRANAARFAPERFRQELAAAADELLRDS